VTLEHLQLLAVLEADDEIGRHRSADRHRGLGRLRAAAALVEVAQGGVNRVDHAWKIGGRQRIVPDVGGDDLAGHA
jgi:hypothetical protein